ncbi:MAG: S53 family peptidase [Frankia sp.]
MPGRHRGKIHERQRHVVFVHDARLRLALGNRAEHARLIAHVRTPSLHRPNDHLTSIRRLGCLWVFREPGEESVRHRGSDSRRPGWPWPNRGDRGRIYLPDDRGRCEHLGRRQGEPRLRPGQLRQYAPTGFSLGHSTAVSGDACKEQSWYGEESLDVEAVHGMAPGADIAYVAAASCQISDMNDALQRIVDGRLADVVSGSFSFLENDIPTGYIDAVHATLVQAAIEGVGIFFSAGDRGDNLQSKNVRGVEYPASDPFVTAVGGTSAGISKDGSRLFELGWETATTTKTGGSWTPAAPGTFLAGGGGGVSKVFAQPHYQAGIVPSPISEHFGGRPGRAVPDVAAIGDPHTGYLVGQTETFSDGTTTYVEYRLGGTSLSTPLVASIVALADQMAGRPTGFANYALYRLAGTAAYYDPSSSNRATSVVDVYYLNDENSAHGYGVALRTFNQKQTIYLRTGFDDVTGLGTPNGRAFVAGLAQAPTGSATARISPASPCPERDRHRSCQEIRAGPAEPPVSARSATASSARSC